MDKAFEWIAGSPWRSNADFLVLLLLIVMLVVLLVVAFRQDRAFELWGLKMGPRPGKVSHTTKGKNQDSGAAAPASAAAPAAVPIVDRAHITLRRVVRSEKILIGDDWVFEFQKWFARITVEELAKDTLGGAGEFHGPDTVIDGVLLRFHSNFRLEAGDRAKCIEYQTRFFVAERGRLYSLNDAAGDTRLLQISVERINAAARYAQIEAVYFVGANKRILA